MIVTWWICKTNLVASIDTGSVTQQLVSEKAKRAKTLKDSLAWGDPLEIGLTRQAIEHSANERYHGQGGLG